MKDSDRQALKLALPALEELADGIEHDCFKEWLASEPLKEPTGRAQRARERAAAAREFVTLVRGAAADE